MTRVKNIIANMAKDTLDEHAQTPSIDVRDVEYTLNCFIEADDMREFMTGDGAIAAPDKGAKNGSGTGKGKAKQVDGGEKDGPSPATKKKDSARMLALINALETSHKETQASIQQLSNKNAELVDQNSALSGQLARLSESTEESMSKVSIQIADTNSSVNDFIDKTSDAVD